jgi:hypothetical protein
VGILAGRIRGPGTTTLSHLSFSGSVTANTNVGGGAGYTDISAVIIVSDLTSSVSVAGTGSDIGGIFGQVTSTTDTTLSDLTLSGAVQGVNYIGGVAGSISGTLSLSGVSETGNITMSGIYGGGLFGLVASTSTMDHLSYSGNITTSKSGGAGYIGGLIGRMQSAGSVQDCQVNSQISSQAGSVGGIIGEVYEGSIDGCRFYGNMTVVDTDGGTMVERVGGMVGNHTGTGPFSIQDCTVAKSVSGSVYTKGTINTDARYVGGIAGVLSADSSVAHCGSYMNIIGTQQRISVGIGSFNGTTVDHVSAQGDISVNQATAGAILGGVIGGSYN